MDDYDNKSLDELQQIARTKYGLEIPPTLQLGDAIDWLRLKDAIVDTNPVLPTDDNPLPVIQTVAQQPAATIIPQIPVSQGATINLPIITPTVPSTNIFPPLANLPQITMPTMQYMPIVQHQHYYLNDENTLRHLYGNPALPWDTDFNILRDLITQENTEPINQDAPFQDRILHPNYRRPAPIVNYQLPLSTSAQPTILFPQVTMPTVPQVTIPQVTVPQVTMPTVPQVAIPQVTMPTVPQVAVPQVAVPQVTMPTVPQVAVPQVTMPTVPQVAVPIVPQSPKVTMPVVPQVTVPIVPKVTVPVVPQSPKVTVPIVPKVTVPIVPKVTIPTVPKVTIPTVPQTSKVTLSIAPQVTIPVVPRTTIPVVPKVTATTAPQVIMPVAPKVTTPTMPKVTTPTTVMPMLPQTQKVTIPQVQKIGMPVVPQVQAITMPIVEPQKPPTPITLNIMPTTPGIKLNINPPQGVIPMVNRGPLTATPPVIQQYPVSPGFQTGVTVAGLTSIRSTTLTPKIPGGLGQGITTTTTTTTATTAGVPIIKMPTFNTTVAPIVTTPKRPSPLPELQQTAKIHATPGTTEGIISVLNEIDPDLLISERAGKNKKGYNLDTLQRFAHKLGLTVSGKKKEELINDIHEIRREMGFA